MLQRSHAPTASLLLHPPPPHLVHGGRVPMRLLEIGASKGQEAAGMRGEMTKGRRALIGSRPPRCERVCMSCGHCEAVQVPIVPQDHHHLQKKAAATTNAAISAAMFTYRVDGITNYKPLSWKCRCGGTILDP
ncbi:EPIDERMAL PATTERNING FACTOR-like protein 2 isoform X2 [Setaria viridis]|uniref:Epidermal patterning factor-like protein n=1 Tax=Setaria viridis TaxID=4556 RepID=A0A4V6DAN2_SETVI|nr:EPIDERMAL PATTERNING FACTOR-like protein 2 isoform X2 [Setaria viridis]TKW30356.1 hypothetical protein SEVIR_2G030800v2 [Setaria viridis]